MNARFEITLYTGQDLAQASSMAALWARLMDGTVDPESFGSEEEERVPFADRAREDARRLYQQNGMLFVWGRREGFLAMFSRQPRGLATWNFWIDVAGVNDSESPWVKWIFRLCADLPMLFGRGCTSAEFEAKHAFLRELPGGRRITGQVGISVADFPRFLPGLYWLTLCGREVVEGLGREKLQKLPSVTVIPIDPAQLALILDSEVQPPDMRQRVEQTAKLADALGAGHFFNKERSTDGLTQLKTVSDALSRLQHASGHQH